MRALVWAIITAAILLSDSVYIRVANDFNYRGSTCAAALFLGSLFMTFVFSIVGG